MNGVKFEGLLKELDNNSLETLIAKNSKYSADNDRLHNFNVGADISGRTAAQTCWGYLSKHLVALRDMVEKDDFSDRDDFLEKCQDSINYIRFLWCIGNEEKDDISKRNTMPIVRYDSEKEIWISYGPDGSIYICENGKDWITEEEYLKEKETENVEEI